MLILILFIEVDDISTYLNSAAVRERLGIPEDVKKFDSCSNKVGSAFRMAGDSNYPTIGEVSALLDSGLRILMYVVSSTTVKYTFSLLLTHIAGYL